MSKMFSSPDETRTGKMDMHFMFISLQTCSYETLSDFAVLIRPTVTNKDVRSFLQIESGTIANRILLGMNLEHYGSNKGREYVLEMDVD